MSIQWVYSDYTQSIQGTASIQGVYRDLQHARPLKLFCHLPCLVPCAAGQHWWSIQFTCAQGWRNVPKPPPKRCLRWSVARSVQWPNLFIVFWQLFIGKTLKKILVINTTLKKTTVRGAMVRSDVCILLVLLFSKSCYNFPALRRNTLWKLLNFHFKQSFQGNSCHKMHSVLTLLFLVLFLKVLGTVF